MTKTTVVRHEQSSQLHVKMQRLTPVFVVVQIFKEGEHVNDKRNRE